MQRNTKQRDAIKDVFSGNHRPLSVTEVHELAAAEVPGLGVATVYRNIKALADDGWLEVVVIPGEAPRYEKGGTDHHHHFHCTGCERVFNLEGCLKRMDSLLPKGFQMESHDLTLTGRCDSCGAK